MKIAFVALSGVRIRNAELAALGVSLPGFVERGRVIASLPSLGLLTLAGATPPGHELLYLEHGDLEPQALKDAGVDLVALSTFTAQAPEAYAFAGACRRLGLKVALGGLHATACPEEAAAHADHVFLGEGEATWPAFLADLERGRARACYDVRGSVFPLERTPLPRYDLLDPARYNRLTLQSTRSCPHACTFCASGLLLRGPYRKKPVELVQRDLEAILRRWPGAFLELADDNTFVDRRFGRDLARALEPYRVRWFTETDVSVADDPELLGLLAGAGCRQLLIGLEAPESDVVAGLEVRPFKVRRVADYARAVERIQAAGISVNGTFVVGADTQGPECFARVVDFAREIGLAEVQVTVLTPFPGTPLFDALRAQGRLHEPDDWGARTLFDVCFEPARMSARELEEGLRWTFRELYAPAAVRARRRAFRAARRAGRVRALRTGTA